MFTVEVPHVFKKFGKFVELKRWLYGMRKAASGWKNDYAKRLVGDGFQRGRGASTIFYHPKTHVCVAVHGDNFTFAATESELRKVRPWMCEWDVKVRGILDSGTRDVHEIEILGRSLGWTEQGLEYEASDKHRQGIERGLDDGQQRSSQTRGSRARRGRAVQEIGGDAELHELGQVRCVIRREGEMHEI